MKFGEMLGFTNRLKEVEHSRATDHIKAQRLASIMTDLECSYAIPLFGADRVQQFEIANPELMMLYRTVSDARVWD